MAFFDSLFIDNNRVRELIYKCVDDALNDAVMEVLKNEYFKDGIVEDVGIDNLQFAKKITSTNFKAWLVEYGTGIHMREDNPELVEYKRSEWYRGKNGINGIYRDREDGAIVQRGNVEYTQLDYENGKGVITRKGASPVGKRTNRDQKAQPFLQELLTQAMGVFRTSLNSRLGDIDIMSCIIKSQNNV